MGKYWKKNKAVIITTSIAAIALASFIGLGYAYSNSAIGTDVVGVGAQVADLQYTGGTGNVYEITTNLVEGPIVTSNDLGTLQAKITARVNEEYPDQAITEDQYEAVAYEILDELGQQYAEGDMTEFDTLNLNEQTLVILASTGEVENIEFAASYVRHFRPVTYIGDDPTETPEVDAFDVNGTSYNTYSFGVVSDIYVNEASDVYRIKLRDGSNGKAAAMWENGDYVKAEDIAFGISKQIPSSYASASAYMMADSIANIKYIGDQIEADGATNPDGTPVDDTERWSTNTDSSLTEAEQAIYYGWAPTGDYEIYSKDDESGEVSLTASGHNEREKAIHQEKEFVAWDGENTDDFGISFYDPERSESLYEETSGIAEGEYSYLEFHLNAPSKTFPTQLSSVSYWPLNLDWYIDTIGWTDKLTGFGYNEDTFLSNGAFNLVRFDNLYGIDAEKSNTYWDKDLVTVDTFTYRMVAEAATQAAMFKTGQASYVRGEDANAKVLASDSKTKEWMSYSGKTIAPRSKHMFWNMTENATTDAALYYRDPNFRRAVGHMYNANVYHRLAGVDTAEAVTMFTPMGFLKDSVGNDLVDYGKATSLQTNASVALGEEGERMEYYGSADRKDVVANPNTNEELNTTENTRYDEAYANYYFSVFVDDMTQLLGNNWDSKFVSKAGSNVKTLEIKFLVKTDTDPFLKSLQQSFNNGFTFKPYELNEDKTIKMDGDTPVYTGTEYALDFEAEVVLSSDYMSTMKSGIGFDMASISWGADYYDVWSTLGIFNQYEASRGSNSMGRWTYWDGSDFSFAPGTYGPGNDELARSLFNDGLSQFHDGIAGDTSNANIKGVTLDTSVLLDGFETIDVPSIADQLWSFVLADNDATDTWAPDDRTTDGALDSYIDTGIIYGNHVADFWNTSANEIGAYLVMEIILFDSGMSYIGTTESGSISPSRMLLEGDPVLGYANRSFGFDVTKIPNNSIWKQVEKDLLKLTPN